MTRLCRQQITCIVVDGLQKHGESSCETLSFFLTSSLQGCKRRERGWMPQPTRQQPPPSHPHTHHPCPPPSPCCFLTIIHIHSPSRRSTRPPLYLSPRRTLRYRRRPQSQPPTAQTTALSPARLPAHPTPLPVQLCLSSYQQRIHDPRQTTCYS